MSKEPFYPVQVFWSDEDEGYIAIVPDLPGCSAFGETAEEAIREARDAIEAWLQAARAGGDQIPEPSKPPLHRKYSGKFVVRVPRNLHGQLVAAAEEEGVSLNQFVNVLLSEGITRHKLSASYTHSYQSGTAVLGWFSGLSSTTTYGANLVTTFGAYSERSSSPVYPFCNEDDISVGRIFVPTHLGPVTQKVTHG